MKLAGIVCEYNPFHNGHLYHINETRRVTGCDGVICIMSGPFMQRGIPAIADKWQRANMALLAGADAVFELPFNYAVSSAQFFALGSILSLEALGIDYVSFGTESDTETVMKNASRKCSSEFTDKLNKLLKENISYARAVSEALGETRIMPNDILATEYIGAILKNRLNIKPVCVKRTGCGHDDITTSGEFASASVIRELVYSGKIDEAVRYIPEACAGIIGKMASESRFTALSDFDSIISYYLRRTPVNALRELPFAQGGYADMIKKNSEIYNSASDIASASASLIYTKTRALRFMIQSLVSGEGVRKEEDCVPEYARLLGFRREAADKGILKEMNARSVIPIITSVSDYMHTGSERGKAMLSRDIEAQNLYASVQHQGILSEANRDYTEKLLIV